MQDLKIVTVQPNQVWENKEANFENYTSLLAEIEDVDLIVLPEMFHTCFTMNAAELAEDFNNSNGIDYLKNLSTQKKCSVCASLIIREKGEYFNRLVFISSGEVVKYYDKNKLFTLAKEEQTFSKGTNKVIVNLKGWKILFQVCYDLRFTNLSNNTVQDDGQPEYDIVVYVANWPEKRAHHWNSLLVARAIENQAFVIGVNRVGLDGNGFNYSGNSVIVDANGDYVCKHPVGEESVIATTLRFNNLVDFRNKLQFLKDK